jgi:spore coat polysaccharide biosynthesis protein SpsF (cytidylyltransferase family)
LCARTIRGPEDDVLKRYAIAAKAVGATQIMRITADCPCLDSIVAEQVLDLHLSGGYDYTANCWPRTYPQGYDCEVFSRELLFEADEKATHHICREHVTPYFNGSYEYEQMSNVKRGNLAQEVDESDIGLTLDTVDDYIRICDFLR